MTRSAEKEQHLLFDMATAPSFVGLSATFAPSRDEPLHSWFSYLEGYSREFVEGVQARFMPNAKRIIDPFAGTGTTPLTLGIMGIECGYCEVNPVMQRVIETKLSVASLTSASRRELAAQIRSLADTLIQAVLESPPDQGLLVTYGECFDESVFFDSQVYETILRLRCLCDRTMEASSLLGSVLETAVLSILVTSSRLKRAGDVRYKTPAELAKGLRDPAVAVASQLKDMAADCETCPTILKPPRFLTPNAKNLRAIPKFAADGVITSPPYINGTNYVRNTKLELWFLREIAAPEDLRRIRDAVVTAGINDVTTSKGTREVTPKVREIVSSLRERAYDQRIPRMVAAYCEDLLNVMIGLHAHTRTGAVICVDIGDSQYGGVHVPTADLLTEIALTTGFALHEKVHLRARTSKDGTALSQDLLVFERKPNGDGAIKVDSASWRERWAWFKDALPHQRPPYTARNWGHARHSVCSFQGKMKPALAHFLVECFTNPGQRVLDPFSGSGTIPFEAALGARTAYAFDISMMAFAVTSAKLRPPEKGKLDSLLSRLERFIAGHQHDEAEAPSLDKVRFNRTIPEYFHPDTLREIVAARAFFDHTRDDSHEWRFALACMLHILHGNRPYALSRRSHPITPYAPTGPTEYRPVMGKLRAKIDLVLSSDLPPGFAPGQCFLADILAPWPAEVNDLDAIITSPPFFDSTRFYMTNWMRFWFCGWSREDFDTEPSRFVESLQKQSLEIYGPILRQCKERLKPNGVVVFHLGRSKKCNMAAELHRIAADIFETCDVFEEPVGHCEKHGVRDKGTVTAHQYLVLARQ